jgi:hypothetical protein
MLKEMKDMAKVKLGAIIKEVPKGSLIWYKKAGWSIIEEKPKQSEVNNETNTKKNATK